MQDGQDAGAEPPAGPGIARAAALIAGLTVVARLLGLVRTAVFAKTVGAYCLGTAYVTANTLPNIIYDIVLGGALTSLLVPLLARPAHRSATDPIAAAEVAQTSSALLTWTALILVPVSLAITLAARPVAGLLYPANAGAHCAQAPLITVTAHMLAVFGPQIALYGLAVVLYGILQAHQRFAAPALAPVISSLVVIAAYLIFVPFGGNFHTDSDLAGLPLSAELILSIGTTVGVLALVLTALVPIWRQRIRLRPTLRIPAGVRRRGGGLVVYGITALLTQDAALLVVIILANGHGSKAAVVLYQYGWQVFEAAYAVLAISVAVSAFPALSIRRGADFDSTAAGSVRAVLLMSFLGSALLLALAVPAARFLVPAGQVAQLAAGLALFAPGLAGYGLVASLSRVLLAAGQTRAAAICVGGGWLVVIAADFALVALAPGPSVVAMLALGNTIGLTLAGLALLMAVRRTCGPAALAGAGRAAVTGLAAATAGAGAGAAAAAAFPLAGPAAEALIALLALLVALVAYAGVALVLDGGELRAAAAKVWRVVP
ncbi:MAG: murein biosynthesis integral membrane protein MurJ [Streptosporangiaceae bacterium]